jgi:hypothetical protein
VLDRSAFGTNLRDGAGAYLMPACGIVVGALFFAGELCRSHHAVWPGYVAGVACALVGIAASKPFLDRIRKRLDEAAAAVGLPLIGEGSALLIAVLSVLAPPVGPIALLALLFLIFRGRARGDQKYAGLRILR